MRLRTVVCSGLFTLLVIAPALADQATNHGHHYHYGWNKEGTAV